MKQQLQQLSEKLLPFVRTARQYVKFIFVIALLGIFGFLIFRINQFSRAQPSEDAVSEKLKTVQRPKLDQATLNKIQDLQDQNIQVQSLFDDARNNPFNE